MGRYQRPRPEKLAEKLVQVRLGLKLSQGELIERLRVRYKGELTQGMLSNFELGKREPPITLILAYSQLVGFSTDYLINDELQLPEIIA